MKRLFIYLLRALMIMALFGQMSIAQAEEDHNEARRLLESGDILSLEVILQKLQPRYSGKILKVELEREDSNIVYEVEIVGNDGVVHELYIDARTGDVLRNKVDD